MAGLFIGSDKSKEIAYKSLVRPVMEYGAACWDPYRLEHIKTLEKIQKRALKCCRKNSPLKWDTLTDRRTRIRLCAMFKTYRDSVAYGFNNSVSKLEEVVRQLLPAGAARRGIAGSCLAAGTADVPRDRHVTFLSLSRNIKVKQNGSASHTDACLLDNSKTDWTHFKILLLMYLLLTVI
ncbi:hypothetical protein ANN_05857 [Periplaneta americana]|uniref:Uncharacterized protein n=1 Tax=Periplaneta americana TaxID=6978 RepID=A0ABQ8TCV3_PERAM|nr:hypothetical protein ANN_05857 [Periplaneta americana]